MVRGKSRNASPAMQIGLKLCEVLIPWIMLIILLFGTACNEHTPLSSSEPATITSTPVPSNEFAPNPPAPRFSPGQHLRFDNISTEQGLSQSTVTALIQDRKGFMWFGTEGGLNKYDGRQFTVYKNDPADPHSLSDNVITSIYEDRNGTLWIGTSSGLDRLDRRASAFEHYRDNLTNSSGINRMFVLTIYQDHSGTLWIGTSDEGLIALDLQTDQFKVYKHDPDDPTTPSDNTIHTVYEDQDSVLWIGTGLGLDYFDPLTRTFIHDLQEPMGLLSARGVPVHAINEDRNGVLWIGTQKGLYQWDRAADKLIEYRHDPDSLDSLSDDSIRCILRDSRGTLWIGTRGGLNQFDPAQKRFIRYVHNPDDPQSLISNSIRSIFEDRSGVIWIGTSSGGTSKYARAAQKFALYKRNPGLPDSLSDNNIWSILEDHTGMLWVGTFSAGLNKLDRHSGVITVYQNKPGEMSSLSNNDIRTILEDRNGNIWIGTEYGGLNRFDPQNDAIVRYQHDSDDPGSLSSDRVFVAYEDHLGRLWIGTEGGGLNLWDRDSESFARYQHDANDPFTLSNNDVRAIYEDNSGVLWIGTLGGINLFDEKSDRFVVYRHDPADPSSLSSDFVASVFEDAEGTIWIGTFGGGLNRFDRETRAFTHYTERNGLPDNTVYGILEESDGTLWLSTNNGLSEFDPRGETFRNYNFSDGLQGNQFNSGAFFQSISGEMFFGGTLGLNAFFPEQVLDNRVPPPVVITSFEIFNQTVQTDLAANESLRLSYRDSFISFEFAALDYNAPEKNQYAYKMEGVDRDWVVNETRHYASYTHLPGGEYVFRVKGSNNDGIWNEEGATVLVTIVPPFWVTWWFRGTILVMLLGGVFVSYRLRVRSLKARGRELESQVEQRTAELQQEINQRLQVEEELRQREREKAVAAERGRLARELHDSVTQSLYSLTLFSHAAGRMSEQIGEEKLKQQIGQIGSTALKALKEMRLLVYELRPVELKDLGFIRALRHRLEAVEGRSGIEARLIVDDLIRLPQNAEQELYRITSEALNNALKHAAATSVIVSLRELDGRLELEIVDDGIGFDTELVRDQGGMGLESMRERAEQLGGEVVISSAPGKGTSVKAIIDLERGPDATPPSVSSEEDSNE